ncbi:phosphinothricin N-acetyltransferase [Acrasis kona]|uniref:Phosphinothricin N-acetyltransferase n=1 Tax=Acrasis kona TaxID=1008807 RepID=A0AAW2ZN00_9EUKA
MQTIRLAELSDVPDILNIYKPFVTDSIVSFEYDVPSLQEMTDRINQIINIKKYPFIVLEKDEKVVAYAYASTYKERIAYQWNVEVSVYVSPECQKQGVGRKLYSILLNMIRELGYYNAIAVIALPHDASVGLHESFGFSCILVTKNAGYKLGAWRDVGWWQLPLRSIENDQQPTAPTKPSSHDMIKILEKAKNQQ